MRILFLLCLLFIVKPTFSQLRTITQVNFRSKPSVTDSEIIKTLKGGTTLSNAVLEEGWYHLFIDSINGYVKSDYVANHYFEKPNLSELLKESDYSYILSVNAKDSSLAIIIDNGWGGAVDGPSLSLCISHFSKKDKKDKLLQISKSYITGTQERKEWQQKHIDQAWDEMGVTIQNFLFNNNFPDLISFKNQNIKKVSVDEYDMEYSYRTINTDSGECLKVINTITYHGEEVWRDKNNNFDSGAKEIASVIKIEDNVVRLLLEFIGDYHPYHEAVYFFK